MEEFGGVVEAHTCTTYVRTHFDAGIMSRHTVSHGSELVEMVLPSGVPNIIHPLIFRVPPNKGEQFDNLQYGTKGCYNLYIFLRSQQLASHSEIDVAWAAL